MKVILISSKPNNLKRTATSANQPMPEGRKPYGSFNDNYIINISTKPCCISMVKLVENLTSC
jgi:hypothetical protein